MATYFEPQVQVRSYKEFNLKGWMKSKNVWCRSATDILNIKLVTISILVDLQCVVSSIENPCSVQKYIVLNTYRRMDVKYWSKKFFACSMITSALRVSFWATWKLAPNITLPIQTDRLHANGWFGACNEKKC